MIYNMIYVLLFSLPKSSNGNIFSVELAEWTHVMYYALDVDAINL